MEIKSICEIVRKNEDDYNTGTVKLSKYVDFSLSDNVEKIDAYLNSKHITGDRDSMDREKPFFNICTAAVNIWYRATDIDRKNIKIKATKTTDIFLDFLATIHLQNWMRRDNFGIFLNEWGRTLSRYGSAVVKFIESEGKLHSMVIPWNRLIVDPIDFDNDVVIEVLELTPSQLRKRGYDKEMTDDLIEAATSRETLGKEKKDTKSNFIKIYEVHGELPLSLITGKDIDDDTYVQQMHVVSFVGKKNGGSIEYDDFTLYKGKEEKNPYMITHLIKEDGRTMSIGAVENLFEAQWMINHTKKQIKDQLDLASKLIFQTSDGNFVGQNALNAIESGDILIHAPNQPLTQIANNSHDITSLQNYGTEWKQLATEINGISESMMGQNAPSGTAWRQVEALLQESHSLFELMRENKGLDLERMLTTYILPFIKKKLDNKDEIVASLDNYGIDKIEARYIKNKAIENFNNKIFNNIVEGKPIADITIEGEMQNVKDSLSEQGNVRYIKPSEITIKTWKEIFKDLEWELEIDVTGEQKDNQSDMATLATIFQTVASNPQALQDQNVKLVFNKILSKTKTVSPMELQESNSNQPVNPIAPGGGSPVGMENLVANQPK